MKPTNQYDFIIIGSGFGGSILAMCLQQRGFSVALVEKDRHPRFAIGESSTPAADMILRDLAEEYNLPMLKKLSRYGSWQEHYPDTVCGLKRGFSYYFHEPSEPFKSTRNHSHELLVAASTDDMNSDTNWLRSDVDHLLVKEAGKLGVDIYEETGIQNLSWKGDLWVIKAERKGESLTLQAGWILDATGSDKFSGRFLGTKSSSEGFHTNSRAVYSHFTDAGHWLDYLNTEGFYTDDYPYNPDHSALHHITAEGWMWMLRFNNDLLSAGFLLDGSKGQLSADRPTTEEAESAWKRLVSNYPSLDEILRRSKIAELPGRVIRTGRLQRKLDRVYGDGWIALPHTAGFVDPLHSTGIAWTLSGIRKLLPILEQQRAEDKNMSDTRLNDYQEILFNELAFIDLLVSSCYLTRSNLDLFSAAAMLYFAAVITWEQHYLKGNRNHAFLCPDIPELYKVVSDTHKELLSLDADSMSALRSKKLVDRIRTRISPFNSAGLMDPDKHNMYRHTAVTL